MNLKSIIIETCNDFSKEDPQHKHNYDLVKFISVGLINIFGNDDKEVDEKVEENKTSIKKGECSICLESLDINIALPCGHTTFHKKCIANLIDMKCPICRKRFDKVIDLFS